MQNEERARLSEGRERVLHGDDDGDVGKARVEAAKIVEDEGLVRDRSTDVGVGVKEGLQAVTVRGDPVVALHKSVAFHLEEDGAGHLVVKEEVGDEGPSSCTVYSSAMMMSRISSEMEP